METLVHDVRYGIRMLLRKPGFTIIAVLTLALGIGANSAIFSVVNALLLQPLPFENPSQLMFVNMTNLSKGMTNFGVSLPDFREWRDRNEVFDGVAAFNIRDFNLSGKDEPERISGANVTADFFKLLRVNPIEGRTFRPDEELFGNHRVVILSHALWQQRFGGRRELVGQPITLNGEQFTVIGIMPRGFQFPDSSFGSRVTGLWTPLAVEENSEYNTRGNYWLSVVARLKPGVTKEQAQSNMSAVMEKIQQEFPDVGGIGVSLVSFRDAAVGSVETALWVLLAAVAFVLLIACANVANLLLARATARQKEMAIRATLGASRGRIVRQLLTECLTLGIAGGTFGILLALWGVDVLVGLSPDTLPRAEEIRIDARVFLFTLAVTVLTSLVFGLAPALQASRVDLNQSLKEGGRASGVGSHKLRTGLVIAEVALSLVLLMGAGLMVNSFLRLQNVNPGFNPSNVLTLQMTLPQSRYPDSRGDLISGFFQRLVDQVEALPGVESAAVTSGLPLAPGGWGKLFTREDHPAPASLEEIPIVQYRQTSPDYFATLRIPLMKGRFFTDKDNNSKLLVAIINETAAARFFEGEDPIGKVVKLGPPEELLPPGILPAGFRFPRFTIVGVVSDVKHYGLNQQTRPEVYTPHTLVNSPEQDASRTMYMAVRTTGDPMAFVGAVRSQVLSIDRDQPIAEINSMEKLLSASLAQSRFSTLLLGVFGAVALLLAAVGVYGVMSYAVTQRTHEIGIRMALGAKSGDVFKMVVRQGMIVALAGIAIGLVGALAATRVMSSLLFGVGATDPATFIVVSGILTIVALGACFVPARRATRVDPMIALRYE